MPQFRKKPVVIEAHQFGEDSTGYELLHWINTGQFENGKEFADWVNGVFTIPTLEGLMRVDIGDWVIKGVAGEFYPCKPDIFAATYELVI